MSEEYEGGQMTLIEHLQELRQRIIIMLVALVVATLAGAFVTPRVFEAIKLTGPENLQLTYIEVAEGFFTYFKLSLMVGVGLALPVFIYQIVRFVAPGLTRSEKRYLYSLLPAVFILFLVGAAFSYFLLVPVAVRYFLSFSFMGEPQIRVGNYVDFASKLIFGVGLAFETPLLVWFLCKINLVSPRRLAGLRRYAIVLAFVVGAVITPTPDPLNQALVSVPVYLLFELGILMARVFK